MIRFKQFLFESKIDFLAKSLGKKIEKNYLGWDNSISMDWGAFEPSIELVKKILFTLQAGDPTDDRRKYLQWIAKQWIARDFRLEDMPRVRTALEVFDRLKRQLPIKDINRYRRLSDLEDAVEGPKEQSNRELDRQTEKRLFDNKDAKIFYKDSSITVIIPKTEEASCFFGKGTKWCTAGRNNFFNTYNRQGTLYIINIKGHGKYQFHFESKQFMDEKDNSIIGVTIGGGPIKEHINIPKLDTLKKIFNDAAIFHKTWWLVDTSQEKNQILMVKNNAWNIREIENPSEKVQLTALKTEPLVFWQIKNPTKKIVETMLNTISTALTKKPVLSIVEQPAYAWVDRDRIQYNHEKELLHVFNSVKTHSKTLPNQDIGDLLRNSEYHKTLLKQFNKIIKDNILSKKYDGITIDDYEKMLASAKSIGRLKSIFMGDNTEIKKVVSHIYHFIPSGSMDLHKKGIINIHTKYIGDILELLEK